MERRMGVEWEERGAWGSFRTPICSAKTPGLASPRQGGAAAGTQAPSGLRVLRPGPWEQPRRASGDVLRPGVEQVHSTRRQQGTAPGGGGFVTAVTTGCHLNSKEQPVAVATVFLVQSPSLVICSPRSYLTPASAVGLHVSPSHPSRGLRVGDRKGGLVPAGSGGRGESRAFCVGR